MNLSFRQWFENDYADVELPDVDDKGLRRPVKTSPEEWKKLKLQMYFANIRAKRYDWADEILKDIERGYPETHEDDEESALYEPSLGDKVANWKR